MISSKTKGRLSKASGIWLLVAGMGLTGWGFFALGTFFASCGINEQGYPTTNTIALVFVPVIIPGLAFLLAGNMVIHRLWWRFSFICLIILCIGAIWLGLIGASWFICAPVLAFSMIAAVFLIISKDHFY